MNDSVRRKFDPFKNMTHEELLVERNLLMGRLRDIVSDKLADSYSIQASTAGLRKECEILGGHLADWEDS